MAYSVNESLREGKGREPCKGSFEKKMDSYASSLVGINKKGKSMLYNCTR